MGGSNKYSGFKSRVRYMEVQKRAKELWSLQGKNYSREELNILARAARVPNYYNYKKHELALKLGLG